jgi:hypothetical protein
MSIDFREIELTHEQKRRVAELAERTGRPWREVLDQHLSIQPDVATGEDISYQDPYINDPHERIAYFQEWIAKQTSHNPNFDDSRESIYFGRE